MILTGISKIPQSFKGVDSYVLLNFVDILVARTDKVYYFDYMFESRKHKDRSMEPFNYKMMEVLVKLKNNLLDDTFSPLKNYHFDALTRLFNSESITLLLRNFFTAEDVSKLISLFSKHIPKIISEKDLRGSVSHFSLQRKVEMTSRILLSLKNISTYYSKMISKENIKEINAQLSDLIHKTSELVHKGYIPLANLFKIFEASERMADHADPITSQLQQKNALTQILDCAVNHYFLNHTPNIGLLYDK